MFRSVCWVAVLLVALGGSLTAQKPKDRQTAKAPKAPKSPKGPPPAAAAAPRMGKKGPTPLERFNRMSPDEQQKALDRLPPERRKKFEEQLNRYNNLTPEMRSRLQAFNQFPPEKQNQARRLFQQFGQLPQERQGTVRQEFDTLRNMSEADRRARINSDEFRNKYNSQEQRILNNLSGLVPAPK